MHGLAVCVKEGPPFARDLSLENCADSYLCYDWLYFTHTANAEFFLARIQKNTDQKKLRISTLHALSVSYFFFLYRSASSFYAQFFILIHLT